MSFFKSIWGGIKSVGGAIGKIFKKKETGVILNAAASIANNASAPAGYDPAFYGQAPAPSPGAGTGWLDWLNGTRPLDLNQYVQLPTVNTSVKPVNFLLLGGVVLAAIMVLKKK